jgi:hypothetical protein
VYLVRLLAVFVVALPGVAVAQDSGDEPAEEQPGEEQPDQSESAEEGGEAQPSDATEPEEAADATAAADEKPKTNAQGLIEPTEKQAELNTKAVEAITAKEYDKAIELLRESLEIGELNITFLNLGRAHQKLEECGSAKSAYLEALSAPQVEQPSPYLVDQKVEEYMTELEEQCTEEDWEKKSEGSAGTGEYTWDPRPEGSSPMIRIGLGLGTGGTVTTVEGDFTVDDNLGNTRTIEDLVYRGLTVKLEGVGGYFVNRNLAIHGGLSVYILPTPISEFHTPEEDVLERPAETSPETLNFSMVTVGVTGYTPGDAFISGGVGVGFGSVDEPDPAIDFSAVPGFGFNVIVGKDFQIDEQFGFGLGGYFDGVVRSTDAGYQSVSVTLGIQSHGIVRIR